MLANSGVFLFEGFRLDQRAGVLFRSEHSGAVVPIGIGSRALDVLGVLVERAGDLVSRDQIIAAVWPLTAVGDNNLNMQIAALRRVLDEARTGRSSIQTVAGRGYRFAVPVTRVEADLPCDATLSSPPAADPPAATSLEAPPDQAERRQITALACELIVPSGPTQAGNLEDLRRVVGAFRQCISESAAHHYGFVFSSLGNTVLVLFGYPTAHENDAEHAVRAGLELCISVPTLRTHGDFPTRCRVGIETGMVIIGDSVGDPRDQTIVGDAPMLATRLQALAQPDTVTIGPTIRRLIGSLFDYRDLGAIEVGGLAGPVPAWQVLRASAIESRFEALRGSALTTSVGRNEEIDQLLRRWSRAKSGDGQVVLVTGEPGIGKSRLCAELEQRLHAETHLRRRYFCSPYHRDSVLSPFIDQLGRAAGFARDDPPATRLDKLAALIGPAAAEDDVAFLANLLSLPPSQRYPLPTLSPLRIRERTLQALIRQLEASAREQPVLMVFEDAQWIDPSSQELLDLTIEHVGSLPVLLIITFRPEFQPPWTGQARVTTLALNRLDRRDRTVLAAQLAGDKGLPDEVVEQIADRTDGVPLFVEELTKSVLESGLLREEADRYVLDRALPPLAVPTSLHDGLLARLDRLSTARGIAQTGAAIGREFSYQLLEGVARLDGGALREALSQPVRSELVYRRGEPPQAVYSFKHALVRDAAIRCCASRARNCMRGSRPCSKSASPRRPSSSRKFSRSTTPWPV